VGLPIHNLLKLLNNYSVAFSQDGNTNVLAQLIFAEKIGVTVPSDLIGFLPYTPMEVLLVGIA